MNASVAWLGDFVESGLEPTALRDLLTARAATVDAVEPVRADLAPLVVGLVRSAERHPDSDHLWVTTVDVGGPEPIDVICGAPNVAVGGRYPFAPIGATLPGGARIEQRKIRGRVSNGMLCSARELGLGTDHEGILLLDTMAAPGTPLLAAIRLGDVRLVVDVLPNRPDLLAHQGLAREIAAATGRPLRAPLIPGGAPLELAIHRMAGSGTTAGVRVTVEDAAAAPAYLGVVVRGVRVTPSPPWLAERLGAVGVRSISNVVDVTNYMLHGFGQPMHAIDLAAVTPTHGSGEVRVRRARGGERLTTLDGVDRALDPSMLVIAGAADALAIAGVIGGKASGVSDGTTDVFLEIASFDPTRIRATRRALGVSTDASYRFERLVPVTSPAATMDHAVALLLAVAGGRVADTPVLVADAPPAPIEVRLRTARVRQVIGVSVSAAESARLLAEVGFHAVQEGDVLRVTVPPFRTDVEHEIDLVEEVARLYGYDRIPGALQAFRVGTVADDRLGGVESRLRDALVGLGFLELRSMPFVASAPSNAVRVVNPLVQTEAYLRGTLLDTLGRRAEFNLTHAGEGNLRLFEIGTVFAADQTSSPPSGVVRPREEVRLAALAMGARRPPHFTEPAPPMWDEWDAKGLGEIVAQAAYPGSVVELRPSSGPATEVSAGAQRRLWEICVDGTSVGEIARVGLDRPAWAADAFGVEVRLEQVASADVAGPGQRVADGDAQREGPPDGGAAGVARYTPIPPLPASWLDMTLVLPDGMPAAEVERVVLGARDPLLERLELVDEFRGGTVPDGHRSVTWRLTFRDSLRTLVEKQVEARRDKLLRALETELGVRQRTI